jgi:hypothetical protein
MLSTIHTKFMKSNSTHLGIYNKTFKMGHAVLFYTCGNTHYYYEDYSGPSELPWNTLSADDLSNLIFIPYYTVTKNNIEINYRNYPCINTNNELKTLDGIPLQKKEIAENFTKYYTSLNNNKKQVLKDTLKLSESPNDEEKVEAFYACSYKIMSVITQEMKSSSSLEVENTGHEFTPSIRGKQSAGSLTVYWTRHALSCANVLKDLGKKGKRSSLAPNSSIANIGIEQCLQFKDQIQRVIGTDLDFVGASALLRAQQTAALLYNPETVHVLPYISEKRSLLPDDDNQPMTETENTAMYQKFKEYMEEKYKYISDTDERKVKSVLKYEFKDMFGIEEKEAFKVKSDPMLILPKIYDKLKENYPEKKDFHIAIVSHQGWLKDAGITKDKIMNCGVVKQEFIMNDKQTLVRKSPTIVFPKGLEQPSIKMPTIIEFPEGLEQPSIELDGQEFKFTPTITPSLKDVLYPKSIQGKSVDEQILRSYIGICEFMQKDYITGVQAKPVQNFVRKTLKKGRNVGQKVAVKGEQVVKEIQKGTRKVAQKVGSFLANKTRKVGKRVLSGIGKYTAPEINTSDNFFNLGSNEYEESKKKKKSEKKEESENTNEIVPGVTRKNFSNETKAIEIMKTRMTNLKTRKNQRNRNVDRLSELKENPITELTNDEQAEAGIITARLLDYKRNIENFRKLVEESNAMHGTKFIKKD